MLNSPDHRTVPPPGTVKKILFQLIACGIMDIQFDQTENDILIGLSKANEDSTDLAMNVDNFWDDIKVLD